MGKLLPIAYPTTSRFVNGFERKSLFPDSVGLPPSRAVPGLRSFQLLAALEVAFSRHIVCSLQMAIERQQFRPSSSSTQTSCLASLRGSNDDRSGESDEASPQEITYANY
jgi:hypothetical protein